MNAPFQEKSSVAAVNGTVDISEDEFLRLEDLTPFHREAAERSLRRTLGEMAELITEKKWVELVELFSPVEQKLPELVEHQLDVEPRAKIAFAMGQVHRFDEAIRELSLCVKVQPNDFRFHSSLAYTAYNSLYAAKNRELLLSGKMRAARIELAHAEFKKAQDLRPDGVTNFYREGMLFKQIENKTRKAIPLFLKAVSNWEALDEEEKKIRHQERKNHIKALYHLSNCFLDIDLPRKGLQYIKRCLDEDEGSNHFSRVHKYFAMGKIHFHLNDFSAAKDALVFSLQCRENEPVDFVYELLARTYLALGDPDRAMETIQQVPEKRRKPYYRWTEADVLCARKRFQKAREVLFQSQERDTRSRHKSLIRLSRIEYMLGDYESAMKHAKEAYGFFQEKWGGILEDGLFWQALCAHRLGSRDKALVLAKELEAVNAFYPKLKLLLERLSNES